MNAHELNLVLSAFYISMARIYRQYMQLPMDGGGIGEQERLYLAELFHQLRTHASLIDGYMWQCEVDKRQHPDFHGGIAAIRPDLLYHIPGDHRGNAIVVEVKMVNNVTNANIRHDIDKISCLLQDEGRRIGYKIGVLLLVGGNHEALLRVRTIVQNIVEELDVPRNKFLLFWHRTAGAFGQRILLD